MTQNTNNILKKKLDEFLEKNIAISQDGFMEAKFPIHKFRYIIESEILKITDEEDKNYLALNLNQIYKTEINENNIKVYLDNDTTICLKLDDNNWIKAVEQGKVIKRR